MFFKAYKTAKIYVKLLVLCDRGRVYGTIIDFLNFYNFLNMSWVMAR